jgi:hypothetical protein
MRRSAASTEGQWYRMRLVPGGGMYGMMPRFLQSYHVLRATGIRLRASVSSTRAGGAEILCGSDKALVEYVLSPAAANVSSCLLMPAFSGRQCSAAHGEKCCKFSTASAAVAGTSGNFFGGT